MRVFNFFVRKIFLRRVLLAVVMMALLLLANYTTFVDTRSALSAFEGYRELTRVNPQGSLIANLDPDSWVDMDVIDRDGVQAVYDYLDENFDYAFFSGGYMISIPDAGDMEISLCYMNEEYYNLNQFKLSQGENLDFDYEFDLDGEIPVLIGAGLGKTYPVGSAIQIDDPALGETVTLKVDGILRKNASHSNYYMLNWKNYYNFSIFVPVNEKFMENANIDLPLNALMDMIVLNTTQEKTTVLSELIDGTLDLKFNFFSQEENLDYFKSEYSYSFGIILAVTLILLVVAVCLSVWNVLVGVRLMRKDFTINLLFGMSYSRLRKIFYGYYGLMFFVNWIIVFAVAAAGRYGAWISLDSTIATYGLFGLIGMDWLALFAVLLTDIIVGIIIVEIVMRKIKKISFSMGVLQ